jgi:hypothetical protein
MRIKKSSRTFATIGLIVLLNGCGSGKVVVNDAIETQHGIKTVTIVCGKHVSPIPKEFKEAFEKNLKEKLYDEFGYKHGDDLTVVYRFLQCDEGSRFSRWFLGGLGNSGESSLTIEAKFIDKSGKELGKINAEGKIGSGFLGGSFDNAIEQASDHLAEYIVKNFCK